MIPPLPMWSAWSHAAIMGGSTFPTSSLRAWYRAAGTYQMPAGGGNGTPQPGDPVGYWADETGNGYHLVATGSGTRPNRAANSFGVVGDGTDDFLQSTGNALPAYGAAGWTILVKLKRPTTSYDADGLLGFGSTAARFGGFGNGGGTETSFFDDAGSPTFAILAPATTDAVTVGLMCSTGGVLTGIKSDGTTVAAGTAWTSSAIQITPLSEGASANFSAGTIIEIATWAKVLTAGELSTALAYFATDPPAYDPSELLLQDGTSRLLLEDGTSTFLLE